MANDHMKADSKYEFFNSIKNGKRNTSLENVEKVGFNAKEIPCAEDAIIFQGCRKILGCESPMAGYDIAESSQIYEVEKNISRNELPNKTQGESCSKVSEIEEPNDTSKIKESTEVLQDPNANLISDLINLQKLCEIHCSKKRIETQISVKPSECYTVQETHEKLFTNHAEICHSEKLNEGFEIIGTKTNFSCRESNEHFGEGQNRNLEIEKLKHFEKTNGNIEVTSSVQEIFSSGGVGNPDLLNTSFDDNMASVLVKPTSNNNLSKDLSHCEENVNKDVIAPDLSIYQDHVFGHSPLMGVIGADIEVVSTELNVEKTESSSTYEKTSSSVVLEGDELKDSNEGHMSFESSVNNENNYMWNLNPFLLDHGYIQKRCQEPVYNSKEKNENQITKSIDTACTQKAQLIEDNTSVSNNEEENASLLLASKSPTKKYVHVKRPVSIENKIPYSAVITKSSSDDKTDTCRDNEIILSNEGKTGLTFECKAKDHRDETKSSVVVNRKLFDESKLELFTKSNESDYTERNSFLDDGTLPSENRGKLTIDFQGIENGQKLHINNVKASNERKVEQSVEYDIRNERSNEESFIGGRINSFDGNRIESIECEIKDDKDKKKELSIDSKAQSLDKSKIALSGANSSNDDKTELFPNNKTNALIRSKMPECIRHETNNIKCVLKLSKLVQIVEDKISSVSTGVLKSPAEVALESFFEKRTKPSICEAESSIKNTDTRLSIKDQTDLAVDDRTLSFSEDTAKLFNENKVNTPFRAGESFTLGPNKMVVKKQPNLIENQVQRSLEQLKKLLQYEIKEFFKKPENIRKNQAASQVKEQANPVENQMQSFAKEQEKLPENQVKRFFEKLTNSINNQAELQIKKQAENPVKKKDTGMITYSKVTVKSIDIQPNASSTAHVVSYPKDQGTTCVTFKPKSSDESNTVLCAESKVITENEPPRKKIPFSDHTDERGLENQIKLPMKDSRNVLVEDESAGNIKDQIKTCVEMKKKRILENDSSTFGKNVPPLDQIKTFVESEKKQILENDSSTFAKDIPTLDRIKTFVESEKKQILENDSPIFAKDIPTLDQIKTSVERKEKQILQNDSSTYAKNVPTLDQIKTSVERKEKQILQNDSSAFANDVPAFYQIKTSVERKEKQILQNDSSTYSKNVPTLDQIKTSVEREKKQISQNDYSAFAKDVPVFYQISTSVERKEKQILQNDSSTFIKDVLTVDQIKTSVERKERQILQNDSSTFAKDMPTLDQIRTSAERKGRQILQNDSSTFAKNVPFLASKDANISIENQSGLTSSSNLDGSSCSPVLSSVEAQGGVMTGEYNDASTFLESPFLQPNSFDDSVSTEANKIPEGNIPFTEVEFLKMKVLNILRLLVSKKSFSFTASESGTEPNDFMKKLKDEGFLTDPVAWLINMGLARGITYCPGCSQKKLKLVQMPVFADGYAWCCLSLMCKRVEPFIRSPFFDKYGYSLASLLAAVYHWAFQSDYIDVLRDTSLSTTALKELYQDIQKFCSAIVAGYDRRCDRVRTSNEILEMSVFQFGSFIIIGAFERNAKFFRFQAISLQAKSLQDIVMKTAVSFVFPNQIVTSDFRFLKNLSAYGIKFVAAQSHIQNRKDTGYHCLNLIDFVNNHLYVLLGKYSAQYFSLDVLQGILDELQFRLRCGMVHELVFKFILCYLAKRNIQRVDIHELHESYVNVKDKECRTIRPNLEQMFSVNQAGVSIVKKTFLEDGAISPILILSNGHEPITDTGLISISTWPLVSYLQHIIGASIDPIDTDIQEWTDKLTLETFFLHPVKWLVRNGFAPGNTFCDRCKSATFMFGLCEKKFASCKNNGCRNVQPFKRPKFFSIFSFGMNDLLLLTFHWAVQSSYAIISQDVRLNEQKVWYFFWAIQKHCSIILKKIVKLDNQCRSVEIGIIQYGNFCIFGALNKQTKLTRLTCMPVSSNYNSSLFEPILDMWLNPGTVVHTSSTGFNFAKYKTCIDDEKSLSINLFLKTLITNLFSRFSTAEVKESLIQGFLDEVQWRQIFGSTPKCAFLSLLTQLSWDIKIEYGDLVSGYICSNAGTRIKITKNPSVNPQGSVSNNLSVLKHLLQENQEQPSSSSNAKQQKVDEVAPNYSQVESLKQIAEKWQCSLKSSIQRKESNSKRHLDEENQKHPTVPVLCLKRQKLSEEKHGLSDSDFKSKLVDKSQDIETNLQPENPSHSNVSPPPPAANVAEASSCASQLVKEDGKSNKLNKKGVNLWSFEKPHANLLKPVLKDCLFILKNPKRKRKNSDANRVQWVVLDEYYFAELADFEKKTVPSGQKQFVYMCNKCKVHIKGNIEAIHHSLKHVENEEKNSEGDTENFICNRCFSKWNSEEELKNHVTKVHLHKNSLSCLICSVLFSSSAELCSHMKDAHFPCEMPYMCPACTYYSSLHADVLNHFEEIHKYEPHLMCPYCLKMCSPTNEDEKVLYTGAFFKHIQRHKQRNCNVKCFSCCLQFFSFQELFHHALKDHASFSKYEKAIPFIPRQDPSIVTTEQVSALPSSHPAMVYVIKKIEELIKNTSSSVETDVQPKKTDCQLKRKGNEAEEVNVQSIENHVQSQKVDVKSSKSNDLTKKASHSKKFKRKKRNSFSKSRSSPEIGVGNVIHDKNSDVDADTEPSAMNPPCDMEKSSESPVQSLCHAEETIKIPKQPQCYSEKILDDPLQSFHHTEETNEVSQAFESADCDVNIRTKCMECGSIINENHFFSSLSCYCGYSTYCANAFAFHMINRHSLLKKQKVMESILAKQKSSQQLVFCSCSFSCTDIDMLAKHLQSCSGFIRVSSEVISVNPVDQQNEPTTSRTRLVNPDDQPNEPTTFQDRLVNPEIHINVREALELSSQCDDSEIVDYSPYCLSNESTLDTSAGLSLYNFSAINANEPMGNLPPWNDSVFRDWYSIPQHMVNASTQTVFEEDSFISSRGEIICSTLSPQSCPVSFGSQDVIPAMYSRVNFNKALPSPHVKSQYIVCQQQQVLPQKYVKVKSGIMYEKDGVQYIRELPLSEEIVVCPSPSSRTSVPRQTNSSLIKQTRSLKRASSVSVHIQPKPYAPFPENGVPVKTCMSFSSDARFVPSATLSQSTHAMKNTAVPKNIHSVNSTTLLQGVHIKTSTAVPQSNHVTTNTSVHQSNNVTTTAIPENSHVKTNTVIPQDICMTNATNSRGVYITTNAAVPQCSHIATNAEIPQIRLVESAVWPPGNHSTKTSFVSQVIGQVEKSSLAQVNLPKVGSSSHKIITAATWSPASQVSGTVTKPSLLLTNSSVIETPISQVIPTPTSTAKSAINAEIPNSSLSSSTGSTGTASLSVENALFTSWLDHTRNAKKPQSFCQIMPPSVPFSQISTSMIKSSVSQGIPTSSSIIPSAVGAQMSKSSLSLGIDLTSSIPLCSSIQETNTSLRAGIHFKTDAANLTLKQILQSP